MLGIPIDDALVQQDAQSKPAAGDRYIAGYQQCFPKVKTVTNTFPSTGARDTIMPWFVYRSVIRFAGIFG